MRTACAAARLFALCRDSKLLFPKICKSNRAGLQYGAAVLSLSAWRRGNILAFTIWPGV